MINQIAESTSKTADPAAEPVLIEQDLFEMTRNYKGREYVGTNFMKSPRPERFKRYDGSYIRLKSSMTRTNEIIPHNEMNANLLEQVLLISYGLTSVKFYGYQSEMVWSIPSAGACYPAEVYLVVNNVKGVMPGVYHYSAVNAIMHRISDAGHDFLLRESLMPEDHSADFYIVFTIVPWRSCWKYSYRGYRFSFLDSGHILANFQLVLKAMNLPFSTYTQCRSKYIKTLLNLGAMEEPVGIISVNGHQKSLDSCSADKNGHITVSNDQSGREVGSKTFDSSAFDWGPLLSYQERLASEIKTPTPKWLSSSKIPSLWQLDELSELIFKRRSCAAFLPVQVSKANISELLLFIERLEYPIMLYAVFHAVEGYKPGLYRIDGAEAILLEEGDFRSVSTRLCLDQEFVYDASIVLFFAVDRSGSDGSDWWNAQQRLIDAGSLSQMFYLKCKEQNLGFSAIGGYYDMSVRELFRLTDNFEMIYSGVLGKEDSNSAFRVKKDRYQLNLPTLIHETRNEQKGVASNMLIDLLKKSTARYQDRLALKFEDTAYTYAEFWERIELRANHFKEAIPYKYPVGIYMKNHPEYLLTYYGLLMSGHIPMLIDHTFTQEEVNFIRENYHLGSIIGLDKSNQIQIELFSEEYEAFDADQFVNVATCRFSSGTTGKPKCLMFTHTAVINAAVNWAKSASIAEYDIVLCTALFHNGLAFNTSLLSVFLSGALLVIPKQLTPRSIWETITVEEITVFVAFPVVFDMLSKSKYCDSKHHMRLCISSSAPLHYSIKNAFKEKIGVTVCDYYGIVEAGPATFNDSKYPDSLGRPIEGVELRVVNEEGKQIYTDEPGILQIKSSSMAKGYYNSDVAFPGMITPDGYYHTNDRAFIRGGYLYVTGRTNDMINVAGKKVDPFEIENVLLKQKGVLDVAVVGISNSGLTSEYPVAFLVTDGDVDESMIIKHCQHYLAPFKLPQKYVFIDQIPRSGIGKINRQKLIEGLFEEIY